MASRRVSTTRRKWSCLSRATWLAFFVAFVNGTFEIVASHRQRERLEVLPLRAGGVSCGNVPAQPSHSGTSVRRMSKWYVATLLLETPAIAIQCVATVSSCQVAIVRPVMSCRRHCIDRHGVGDRVVVVQCKVSKEHVCSFRVSEVHSVWRRILQRWHYTLCSVYVVVVCMRGCLRAPCRIVNEPCRISQLLPSGTLTTPGIPGCSNVCPAGYGVASTGGSVCMPCANNTFNAGDSMYCSACPIGTTGWQHPGIFLYCEIEG